MTTEEREKLNDIKDTVDEIFSAVLGRASDDCIADLHGTYSKEKESTKSTGYDIILNTVEKEIVKRWLYEQG